MANESFTITRATPNDKPRILETMRELFGDAEGDLARRHAWLYEQNPHGEAVTWIATDNASGEVAGVTSFFPRKLAVGDAVVKGALGGDGFVRPKFRRRGIMQAMHKR